MLKTMVSHFTLTLLLLFGASSGISQLPVLPSSVPGPDVIVGDVSSLQQLGSSGTQVGLAVGSDACNNGDMELNFFAMPNTDHPVMSQNLYRMTGGAANDDRFEQIGQSWLAHSFFALQNNGCGFGCTSASSGTHLGAGCSNADSASINGGQSNLGSRAWVNPFTGVFPSTANGHSGHTHIGTSHRILVEGSDLDTAINPGATYYAEAQFVSPHEYTRCQTYSGQCNMYNNASYRRFNVTGTTSFIFAAVGPTIRMTPAINAWTGATINTIEPAPGIDGQAFIGFKVTSPVAGSWHYEYAIYNQNLDRSIQSFSVPLGCGITVSNLGFHAPLNAPGFANDGTFLDAGFSNAAWSSSQTADALSWNSETFAQNQNANAIRWGTLYNFRFDSNRPPQVANATIGFFKTGSPITVAVQAPAPDTCNPLQFISAVSRKTHGNAGDFDVSLPLSGMRGVECRNGGVNGDHTLVIAFTNTVVSGNATVTSGTGSVVGAPAFSNNIMTVNLTGVVNAQAMTVTLSNVTDSFSQVLPDTTVSAGFLLGDTNGDTVVNAGDALQTRNRSGQATDSTNFRSDVNTDSSVNSGDTLIVRSRSGTLCLSYHLSPLSVQERRLPVPAKSGGID